MNPAGLRTGRGARLLPPPVRARDWLPAGIAAGLCLASAELLALAVQDVGLSPRVAVSVAGLDAAAVAALCVPPALAQRLSSWRPSHSALVGGVLGPLLAARSLPLLLPPAPAVAAGVAALAAALGCGLAAARAGGRLEAAGVPISGPPLWLAVSLLLVGASSLRRGGPLSPSPAAFLVLGGLVLLLALLAAFLAVFGARREALVPWPFGRLVLALALLAGGVALAPRALPWLLMEPPRSALRPTSPNLLLVDLGAFSPDAAPALGGDASSANLTLLAAQGSFYRRFLPGPEPAGGAWLRLADGLPVARALEARGYRVRSLGPPGSRPPGFDTEPSADLDAALAATLGGGLLARLGGGVAPDPDGSAAARAAEARRRIAFTRALEPDRPLFLAVDFSDAPRDVGRMDGALGTLLDLLADLDLDDHARIAVVWREEAADGGLRGRAIVRPELAGMRERGRIVEMPVLGAELAGLFSGLAPADPQEPAPQAKP